ncbi:unnamed protein product [Caenorhabditis angaria]|uniref:SET domain-containing protein n=1 Tax=Caenorhabditis angaria TaxID=860376 RepID=A0A9P1ISH8_9PELO|nr:unnamed protein product [Caenorhabditis angaria]
MNYQEIATTIRGSDFPEDEELAGCECDFECNSENCSCLMNGESNYSEDAKVIRNSKPLLECHSDCSCQQNCGNRVVQKGIRKKLEIFSTNAKGFGVKTLEIIDENEFVCEYAGECINEKEVERRNEEIKYEDNYTLTIKEHFGGRIQKTFIDPRKKGNIGRFLNHSCEPNCDIVIVRIGRIIPIVGLFARRKIEADEELTYDYGESLITDESRKKCECQSENCRKFLPMSISPVE